MTHAHTHSGLVLVADSARLYDEATPPSRARFAADLVVVAGSMVVAYGLSFATLFTRRRGR